jgi:fido (protein-threonine AMPylation protein)
MKDPYLYPGTETLRNLFGVEDDELLDAIEADYTGFRIKALAVKPIDGEGNTRTIITFCIDFAEDRGFSLRRELFAENSEYVRTALVAASAILHGHGDLSKQKYHRANQNCFRALTVHLRPSYSAKSESQ